MKEVEIITANLNTYNDHFVENKIKKVCAYARVSTDSEEQLTSYESQIKYYTEKINVNPDWKFVGIYADEGISGTQVKKRTEFMRMIDDALEGKIDMIMAKSISRFARNTIDTLKYVRQLREHNVDVYFEKEDLHTIDMDSEMFLTFYSAFAQGESESISMNIKLGNKAKMKRGEPCGQARCYGYNWNKETQELEINEKEAEIVRQMFNWYINGKGTYLIAKELNRLNIPTTRGKKWVAGMVRYIINNEKLVGDLVSQKYYVENPISHKVRVNKGEKDLYKVKNHHKGIVSREVWNRACEITEKRKIKPDENGKINTSKYSLRYPFSSRIVCGICGATHTRKMGRTRHDGTRIYYWACQRKANGSVICPNSIFVRENILEETFIKLYNALNDERTTNNINLLSMIKKMIEEQNYSREITKLENNKQTLEKRLSNLVDMKLDNIINNEIYVSKENEIRLELNNINKKLDNYKNEMKDTKKQLERLNKIEEMINSTPRIDKFNGECFENMIDKIVIGQVDENGKENTNVIKFIIKGGRDFDFIIENNKSIPFKNETK